MRECAARAEPVMRTLAQRSLGAGIERRVEMEEKAGRENDADGAIGTARPPAFGSTAAAAPSDWESPPAIGASPRPACAGAVRSTAAPSDWESPQAIGVA